MPLGSPCEMGNKKFLISDKINTTVTWAGTCASPRIVTDVSTALSYTTIFGGELLEGGRRYHGQCTHVRRSPGVFFMQS